MTKMFYISEVTVLKLYQKILWEDVKHNNDIPTIATMIVDDILEKLEKSNTNHPLKELYKEKTALYELIHFVFVIVEQEKQQ